MNLFLIAGLLFMSLVTHAFAVTGMDSTVVAGPVTQAIGIDMHIVLKGEDGSPIKDQYVQKPGDTSCEHCPELTLGNAISHALLYSYPDEKDLPWEQKYARSELATKIRNSSTIVLSAAEIVTIKILMNKMYNTLVVGDAAKLLEPNISAPSVAIPK